VAIRVVDPQSYDIITFNLEYYKSRISYQLSFEIIFFVHNQHIHHSILDEGASTCFISLSYCKGHKSPGLNQYPTMLKEFDGKYFRTHALLQSLSIQLGGKNISIDVFGFIL
jgi:hypothetical protein